MPISRRITPRVTEFDKFPVRSVRECAYATRLFAVSSGALERTNERTNGRRERRPRVFPNRSLTRRAIASENCSREGEQEREREREKKEREP